MPKLLSRIEYSAFLAYSPNGPDAEPHLSSKKLTSSVKNDVEYLEEPAIDLAARRLVEERPEEVMGILRPNALLVPAPGSAPIPRGLNIPLKGSPRDFLWIPRRICEALCARGIAQAWEPLISRGARVVKSSTSRPENRPKPQTHLDSLILSRQAVSATEIVVVDDVVTRGATLLACCSLLQSAYPAATIRGFALLRAVSDPVDFREILDPVRGQITLRDESGDTLRRP